MEVECPWSLRHREARCHKLHRERKTEYVLKVRKVTSIRWLISKVFLSLRSASIRPGTEIQNMTGIPVYQYLWLGSVTVLSELRSSEMDAYPEHLDCRDRAFVIKNCSDNCARQRSDVHGQLELQKFRYAVVNLTRTLGAPKKPNLCSYLTSIINSTWSHAKDHNLQVNGRPYLITWKGERPERGSNVCS